ncbi:MAG: hypothetical protein V4689_05925 [Verrucomicrobiota bacterium]
MNNKITPEPFAAVRATGAKIIELEEKSSALRIRRAGLSIDSSKEIEKEIAAKMKTEAEIDAALVPLELALEHLRGGICQQWNDVENFYLADVRVALAEVEIIAENARVIGLNFLEILFPCEDSKEFRDVFTAPTSAFSPFVQKPLGALTPWMRGVSESIALSSEISRLCQGWGNHTPDINSDMEYVSVLMGFLESYPARKAAVLAAVAELESCFVKSAAAA